MTEQRKKEVAERIMSNLDKGMNLGIKDQEELEVIREAMSAFFCIDQYRWERDVALDQLKQLGLSLGQKIDGVYVPKKNKDELDKLNESIQKERPDVCKEWTCETDCDSLKFHKCLECHRAFK